MWKNKVYVMNDKVDFYFVNVCIYIYIYISFGVIYNESFRKRQISMMHSIFIETRGVIYGMLIIQLGRNFSRDA